VTPFRIGTLVDSQHPVRLDIPRLVDTRLIVQSNSGGGKSWLLRLIAEEAAPHVQVVILDPEGEFPTLRERFDFALVGKGGEIAAETRTAGLLARHLAELRFNAVIDLYDLSLPDKRLFVRLFLESLLAVPRVHWHPLLLMLDEAHKFAPESGKVESTNAVIALMDSGRKRGFAGCISTQRLSKLHKDVSAEANNVFMGRTWQDLDQERAGDILGMRKADRIMLRDLAPGEFYTFGPAVFPGGVNRFKVGKVQTTHPQPGQRHKMDVPRASAAIREIVKKIGDLPAQATEEATALVTAQRRINELERALHARPIILTAPALPPLPPQQIQVPIFKNGEVDRLEKIIKTLTVLADNLPTVASQLAEVGMGIRSALISARTPAPARAPIAAPPAISQEHSAPVVAGMVKMDKARRAVMTVLAQYPMGRAKNQLALLSGYAVNGGGFANAISGLRSAGFLSGGKDRIVATPSGFAALGEWTPLPTGPALRDYWLTQLSKAERACLSVLIENYPQEMHKDEIAIRAGYTPGTGGVNNAFSRLRTLELITGRVTLKASDTLME